MCYSKYFQICSRRTRQPRLGNRIVKYDCWGTASQAAPARCTAVRTQAEKRQGSLPARLYIVCVCARARARVCVCVSPRGSFGSRRGSCRRPKMHEYRHRHRHRHRQRHRHIHAHTHTHTHTHTPHASARTCSRRRARKRARARAHAHAHAHARAQTGTHTRKHLPAHRAGGVLLSSPCAFICSVCSCALCVFLYSLQKHTKLAGQHSPPPPCQPNKHSTPACKPRTPHSPIRGRVRFDPALLRLEPSRSVSAAH